MKSWLNSLITVLLPWSEMKPPALPIRHTRCLGWVIAGALRGMGNSLCYRGLHRALAKGWSLAETIIPHALRTCSIGHACALYGFLILSLSGCGSILPAIPSILKIPVAVPCVDAVPVRPKLATDQELRAMDDYRLILTLRSDGIKARDHIGVLEATLQACVK